MTYWNVLQLFNEILKRSPSLIFRAFCHGLMFIKSSTQKILFYDLVCAKPDKQ